MSTIIGKEAVMVGGVQVGTSVSTLDCNEQFSAA
jgi:hypothetical protein